MRSLLLVMLFLVALASNLAGLIMVSDPSGGTIGLSPSLLDGSPFKDFRMPGILLLAIMGSVSLVGVYFNIQHHPKRYNFAIGEGFFICLGTIVGAIVSGYFHWLQLCFFITGMLIVLTACQLKGKWAV